MRKRLLFLGLLLGAGAAGGFALAASASAQGGGTAAKIVDFGFEPTQLNVAAGTEVTWTNTGKRPHTVTDRGGTFDTDPIAPGGRGSVTFSVPGTYSFFCRINPGRMNGTIVVAPGAQPAAVNRIQALDPGRPGEQLRFDPPRLEVDAGSTVVFANVGGKPHTLTADDSPPTFDTGVVPPGAEGGKFAGASATFTVGKPGTYAFHCEVHPAAMKGELVVRGEAKEGPPPASSAARDVAIDIADFEFKPPEASVAPGGKVTWKNTGNAPHTATFDDVPLKTATLQSDKSETLTAPDAPGSYSYFCSIHPARMRGVLVVLGQNVPDPTPAGKEAAAKPAVATGGGGPGGGVSATALATGVIGAFLGGLGVGFFVRRRPAAAE